jgi:hypothetical protein
VRGELGMNNKSNFIFILLFLFFPLIFLISSFGWRYILQQKELMVVATDCFAILGIYYVISSVFFSFTFKKINLKDL